MCETNLKIQNIEDYLASLRVCAVEAARQFEFLATFTAADEADGHGEFTHLEIAAVSRVSARYAQSRIKLAQTLASRLPRTMHALRVGDIDEYRARRMAVATDVLSAELATQVEEKLIPEAAQLNPQQLNARLRRAVVTVDPGAAAARAKARQESRHVRHDPLEDGAGVLQIQGDVEQTQLAYLRLKAIARHVKSTGDDRGLDQITADVALDCLAGKNFQHAKVHVWLTIPATTALGIDEKPGNLAGYGWLPAQRALELAATKDATWQRVLTDPATGHVVDVGRNKYRPPAALRDHLRATYPTCTGPGCRRPAHLCDQDHVVPFPAGLTDRRNVRPLCRPHHRAKTHGGWQASITPDGLGLMWITKHGYRFPYHPEPIADLEDIQTPSPAPAETDQSPQRKSFPNSTHAPSRPLYGDRSA